MIEAASISFADFLSIYRRLNYAICNQGCSEKIGLLKVIIRKEMKASTEKQNTPSAFFFQMKTALLVMEEIGVDCASFFAIILYLFINEDYTVSDARRDFGEEVAVILRGLKKIDEFNDKKFVIESENYMKFLLSFAEDIRVMFILIAQRLLMMREAKVIEKEERMSLSVEVTYLYAPLAHRLGLYTIKSELEDLALKYTDRSRYDFIARKLNETKRSREKYIQGFIDPVKKQLDSAGLNYDIKGRTKSIHSIHNKLKKQKIEFENIYDLFAIRIILNVSPEMEKAQCWQVYSVITDMYQPNPKRLKDWLSIPKSNGYESLHITVMGPHSRWVEVQIRTRRMDEIAERGLAAHWKYKGIKSESALDNWLVTLRESLENKDADVQEKLNDFKLNLYNEEIFVFTPKGDLLKFPKGATILDFAFSIHTKLGARCVSGKVNGKNVSLKYAMQSGDQIEINTSSHQTPKQDWLQVVVTSRAKQKIRQFLKEEANKQVDLAKEMLSRRFKNRKIEMDDAWMTQTTKKMKFKNLTDFYIAIASEKIDINWFIDRYLEQEKKEGENREVQTARSADSFVMQPPPEKETTQDELVIDQDLTGVDYKLAKCCNPIFGDGIFGFVSSQGIKIHRVNCPNAQNMFSRFGYRVLKARWSGKSGGNANYTAVLRIVGNDHIHIVANLTSIISKEEGVSLRAMNIDSNDGLFQGTLSVTLANTSMLEQLVKKLSAVKGVKQLTRLN